MLQLRWALRIPRGRASLLTGAVLALISCGGRDVQSNVLRVSSVNDDSWISAQGRWVPTEHSERFMISRVNSVEIECKRESGECIEARGSFVTQKDDNPNADFDYLFTHIEHYRIVSSSDRVLIARSDGLAYDLELRIDIKAQTAQRFAREKGARCATKPDATCTFHWELK